jgi:hypothetical protein
MGPLPEFVVVALRWAAAWAAVGLLIGVLFVSGKTLLAGPGAEVNILGYVLWAPVLAGAAAAAGLGIGLIFAGLMAVTADWRDSLVGDGIMIRLGPDVLCGAGAGLVPGFLVGGLGSALFFAFVGGCFAAAFNWWASRTG